MKRRDFLRTASVPAGAATAAATTSGLGAAQEETEGGGGGGTATVTVGPGGSLVFSPGTDEPLQIAPGTTVEFVWESNNHNIVVDSQPEGAGWEGHEPLENSGFTYEHTFETLGTYEYYCDPHQTAGMVGSIEVVENPNAGGGGGGKKELHSFGVPIHAHWVGAATILGIIVTIIFTFYVLKYGESAHTGTGRNS
ncbi:plastocyanin/azurin family copper-binding protein [Halobellus ruber]|uniref:Halocyanin n=1 Tax=Halobellus ruber TaxID=2761102 RepID=A0A7J9SFU4_9EURY|nr:plastocyanin/azurin family copper-binding protein [Halobellus ruber]MBB6645810.1 halocyanin [Halobellus ruber]